MANVKEQVEAKAAVEAVAKADKKVEDIKAERLRKQAEADQKRLEKHPKMGKVDNVIAHNWKKGVAFVLTGGASFAAGWIGHKIFGGKKDAEATVDVAIEETASNEASEAPFDA